MGFKTLSEYQSISYKTEMKWPVVKLEKLKDKVEVSISKIDDIERFHEN